MAQTGDGPGALAAIREAVEVYRRLAQASPARYEPELARSLGSLGIILRQAGTRRDAIAAFREGARLIESYARQYPAGPYSKLLDALERDIKGT